MPIFSVFAEVEIVVDAADEKAALIAATDVICSADGPEIDFSIIDEIDSLQHLPYGWNGDCLPYGRDDDMRLKDLLPG